MCSLSWLNWLCAAYSLLWSLFNWLYAASLIFYSLITLNSKSESPGGGLTVKADSRTLKSGDPDKAPSPMLTSLFNFLCQKFDSWMQQHPLLPVTLCSHSFKAWQNLATSLSTQKTKLSLLSFHIWSESFLTSTPNPITETWLIYSSRSWSHHPKEYRPGHKWYLYIPLSKTEQVSELSS